MPLADWDPPQSEDALTVQELHIETETLRTLSDCESEIYNLLEKRRVDAAFKSVL